MWGWSRCAVLTLLLFAFAANAAAGPLEAMRAEDEKVMSGTAARETKPAAYVSFDHGGALKGEVTVGDVTIKMTVRRGSGNLHDFRLGVQVAGKPVLTHWSRQQYDFAAQITWLDPSTKHPQVFIADMASPYGDRARGFLFSIRPDGRWRRVATTFIRTGGAFGLLARDFDGDGREEIAAPGPILEFPGESWLADAKELAHAERVWGFRHGRMIERSREPAFRFIQGRRLEAFYRDMAERLAVFGIEPESDYLKADLMGYLAAKAHLG
jgi:hypothetical protein